MEIILSPHHAGHDGAFPLPIRVCIIYQDHACAAEAARVREELSRACGRAEVNSWSFESLRVPAVRHAATVDAVGSRLLVVAAREGAALPSYLKFWIGGFLGARTEDACTVVALLEGTGETDRDVGPVQEYLSTIARLDGMEFICRKFTERKPVTKTRRGIAEEDASTPFHAVMAGGSMFEDVEAFHQLQ